MGVGRAAFVVIAVAVPLLWGTASASASAVIRVGTGANGAAIQSVVDQFRTDLGGVDNGVGGAFLAGRREIDWDGVPDSFAEPNPLPFDFFNVNSPRGVVFQSAANIGGQHQFRVSAAAGNPTGTPLRFGNVDPSYSGTFTTFSPERLFAARGATTINVFFYVPGTTIPATVSGFGAVFTDVDSSNTYVEYYGTDGKKLSGSSLNSANNGLSFIGVSFNAGERVARVEMRLGNNPLQSGSVDGTAGVDVVALDDLIYGEPRADPASIRFANARITGAEGDTATVSVVRSGRGPASVDFALSDGTATANQDYTTSSGAISFGIDETVKTITIPLAKDDATEGEETINLTLSNPVGGSLADPSTATLAISDRPPAAQPDRRRPTIVLGRAPKSLTRAKFLGGVALAITRNEPSSLLVELLGTTNAATLSRAGDLTLASRALPLAAGRRTVRLRPSRKLVALTRGRFTARLRVVATDAAGNRTTVTRRIVVRPR